MSAAEDELVRLASGVNWRIDKLTHMQSALDALQGRAARVRDSIRNGHWEGDAAQAAEVQLSDIVKTFGRASRWVQQVHELIDHHSDEVRHEASAKLESLPTGDLPSAVRDAIDRGKPQPMAEYGIIGALAGPAGVITASLFFANQREERAKEAVTELRESIARKKDALEALIRVGFDPIAKKKGRGPGGGGGPEGSGDGDFVSGGPGISGGPGNLGGGPGVGGAPHLPGPGTHPGVPGPGPGSDVPGPDPDGPPHPERPPFPDEPPVRPEPPNPGGGPGEGPGDGNGGPRNPGDGPSVDSGLDGTIGRTGLGAAGLGAVGLAAGAKIASSGSGLGGVLGGASGLGQGIAGLGAGGGLRGAATAAGAGGASGAGAGGSGASGSRAGRPGMMMGGGGGAAGSDKKGGKRGLGGYLAPKLEDEGDGGPAARASRAGGRGDDLSDD